jgi:hypothetical protein
MSTRKCNAANDLADLMSHCEHLETMSAVKAHAEQSQLFSLTDALHPPLAALPNATRRAELCPYYIVPPPPAGT